MNPRRNLTRLQRSLSRSRTKSIQKARTMKIREINIDTISKNLTLILSLISCLALWSRAQAVSPPPDGGYAGGNTAEGQNALFSLTGGGFNTAVGWFALTSNMTGNLNTAIGAGTLFINTGEN